MNDQIPLDSDKSGWAGQMYREAAEALKDIFIAKRQSEFDAELREMELDNFCRSKLPELEGIVESKEVVIARLRPMIKSYLCADFSGSIFATIYKHPAGVAGLEKNSAELAGAFILHHFGKEILALAEKDLASAKKTVADFKNEHTDRLRRIGIIS